MISLRKQTIGAFVAATAVNLASAVAWYATLPHDFSFAHRIPFVTFFISGLLLGALDQVRFVRKAVLLGVVMAATLSLIHWGAGEIGVPVDLRGITGAMFVILIGVPTAVPCAVIGAIVGAFVVKKASRR